MTQKGWTTRPFIIFNRTLRGDCRSPNPADYARGLADYSDQLVMFVLGFYSYRLLLNAIMYCDTSNGVVFRLWCYLSVPLHESDSSLIGSPSYRRTDKLQHNRHNHLPHSFPQSTSDGTNRLLRDWCVSRNWSRIH